MNYAICNETFQDWDHARICDFIAGIGYKGLEIAPFTLAPLITDVSATQRATLRKQAESAGLTIIGLHWLLAKTTGFHLTSPDAEVRRRTGVYLAELARAAADMGGDILVLGSPLQRNLAEGMTREEANTLAADTIGHCLPVLEETGVSLCLEPLGPAETNYMNTAAEGVEVIQKLKHPRVLLHLDVKAMSTEAIPIPELIQQNAQVMKHFHANDPNRRGPGFGDMDFKPIFAALKAVNYTGWVSVEVFDYSPDPETIARDSIAYMKACEA